MGTISVSLPSDGTTADVSDYNTPLTTIVNEFNGNIDNTNVKAGAGIDGSKLADSSIVADKIATGIQSNYVATNEGTTSTSYVELTTKQSVTVTVPNSGKVLVDIGCNTDSATSNVTSYISFSASGANTVSVGTYEGRQNLATTGVNAASSIQRRFLLTGLTAGSTTFTLMFKVNTVGANFYERNIIVEPKA